jgi:regulator of RNase E activity RraA
MAALWSSDEELFQLARQELFTAVVGDVMDQMGLVHQFLPPVIRPIRADMIIIGRAMPVLEADVFVASVKDTANRLMAEPFGLMFHALDDLKPNEVYICTGASPRYALWGEMMSTRALKLGAVGAVVNGYMRDTRPVLDLNFPTFAWGAFAQDQGSRGKVIDFRLPIEIEGIAIHPGDIVFGDVDGVCIIPNEAEVEAFTRALQKSRGEKLVKKALQEGISAVEAWAKFGIM